MEYYTPKEFGALIGLDADTICNRIKSCKIEAINTNTGGKKGRYLIPIAEYNRWLESCKTQKQIYKNIDW